MSGIAAIINTLNGHGIKYKMEEIPGGLSCQFGIQYFNKAGAQVQKVSIDATMESLTLTIGEKSGETNPEAIEVLAEKVVKYRELVEKMDEALKDIIK